MVCRDRVSGYAEGARLGAPEAQACADRWYLHRRLSCSPVRELAAMLDQL
ncbi:hypothetical protein [Actinomadura oligospora]|nr:hypothetical protein [Actinomadura oligospora]